MEGATYGRQTAKVLLRRDGTSFINSFAHGGRKYELHGDHESGEGKACGEGRGARKEGKARIDALRPDEEVGPVMELLDDILAGVDDPEPPMRDAEGWPVEIQCREIVGLHELTADGANDAEDEKSRLPSPKNFLLTKHDKESLEILIGDYVAFIKKTKKEKRAVAPPAKLKKRYSLICWKRFRFWFGTISHGGP